MGEGIVDERVCVGFQGIANRIIAFNAVLAERAADLDIQSARDRGEIGLAVELNRIDAVEIRLAIIGAELAIKKAARLLPPTNLAVQLIQPESPLMLTTYAEQKTLAKLTGLDKTERGTPNRQPTRCGVERRGLLAPAARRWCWR